MVAALGSRLRVPTTASLPDSARIPSTARTLIRSFSRLSRRTIINLALEWLAFRNQPLCAPYLANNRSHLEEIEEDYAYLPAETIEELQAIYGSLLEEKGTKRDVIDRILEGDWRRGISLHQLAMLDFKCLEENVASLRWTALKLIENSLRDGKAIDEEADVKSKNRPVFPSMRISTFVQTLQREISPLVKAHYHVHRLRNQNITILRLFIADTPYRNVSNGTTRTFTDPARTIYIAFPDSCPFLYISVSGQQMDSTSSKNQTRRSALADIASLKRLVLEAVPKALSRPQHRIGLQSTSMTARSLPTMLAIRGNGRSNSANGCFSVFADAVIENGPISASPHDSSLRSPTVPEDESIASSEARQPQRKRRRVALSSLDNNTLFRPDSGDDNDEQKQKRKKYKRDAQTRFGTVGANQIDFLTSDNDDSTTSLSSSLREAHTNPAIDRLHISLQETYIPSTALPSSPSILEDTSSLFIPSQPQPQQEPAHSLPLKLTFHGTHIHAGLRMLVEAGLIDAKRMPSWMTGEEGVSAGIVKEGRLVGGMGGGA